MYGTVVVMIAQPAEGSVGKMGGVVVEARAANSLAVHRLPLIGMDSNSVLFVVLPIETLTPQLLSNSEKPILVKESCLTFFPLE